MYTPEYFDNHFYPKLVNLDHESVNYLYDITRDGGINNVITGLRSHCFGYLMEEVTEDLKYRLFYINGKGSALTGDMIELSLNDLERNNLLVLFSRYLAHNYKLDPLNTFNLFQDKTRTLCEQLDFITIIANELEPYQSKESSIEFFSPNGKRVIILPFFYHEDIYKTIFGELPAIDDTKGYNYIYIMFNARNKLLKIGKSKRPKLREKTLQGEEPEIKMIAIWKATSEVERLLHGKFKHQRQRGEWFKLTFKEVTTLKKIMDEIQDNSI